MVKKIIFYCFSIFFFLGVSAYSQEGNGDVADKRVRGLENQADRKFMQKDFDNAMKLYEEAFKQPLSREYSAQLHLKVARLYLTLLDYRSSLPHYDKAMNLSDKLFTAVDVCNYLDALRYAGEKMKAIGIARKYAYRDVYNSDLRYQNILHALNYENGFLPVGSPEFTVKPVESASSANSEFWTGVKDGEYFYASSDSRFHDPNKKFYHRTSYHSLIQTKDTESTDKSAKKGLVDMIPSSLQNGPFAFSENMTKIVVTQISYDKGESIGITKDGLNAFQTKLYYSQYNEKRKGWSSFKEALRQEKGYSYSHPFLFNNDHSLLFASDMPGGFGGYDLYISHWDERASIWGKPINLGSQVNTSGDEISPSIFQDMLFFSSNGHFGFGGYDIYGITYEDGQILAGSLVHFDYPINTVLNDFSMINIDENSGYIVSDRKISNKDDIFYFERNKKKNNNKLMYGMLESQAISTGVMNLAQTPGTYNAHQKATLPQNTFSEHVLSLYFDFERAELNPDALSKLYSWVKDMDFSKVKSLLIEGFADEMGTEDYNFNLSEKRAATVAGQLKGYGIDMTIATVGKGKISVDDDSPIEEPAIGGEASRYKQDILEWNKKLWKNRKARRVDVKIII